MTHPEPQFDEPRDGKVRADNLVEELGGLPEDNPFTGVVRDLLDEGASWNDIFDQLNEVDKLVDKAALEEGWELVPEWRVTVVVPDTRATSGERYEYHERLGETAAEAEEQVEKHTGYRVESEKTEQVGVGKVA